MGGSILGYIGFNANSEAMAQIGTGIENTLIHAGNIGEYAMKVYGPQGAIDFNDVLYNGIQYTSSSSSNNGKAYGVLASFRCGDSSWQIVGGRNNNLLYRDGDGTSTSWNDWKTIAFTDSNVASATKLQDNTAFTVWGQKFFENGKPKNVNGDAHITGDLIVDGEVSALVA